MQPQGQRAFPRLQQKALQSQAHAQELSNEVGRSKGWFFNLKPKPNALPQREEVSSEVGQSKCWLSKYKGAEHGKYRGRGVLEKKTIK